MIDFLHSPKLQDYALECFELSRDDKDTQLETVEKSWLSEVANYIVKLENYVRFEISERIKVQTELDKIKSK